MPETAVEETEKRNMAVVRKAHEALARGDLETFKSCLAPGYVRHCQAMPRDLQEIEGAEKFLAFLEDFIKGVPGHKDTLSQMMAQEDRVAYVST
jgi:ketosteroid isomerase-like protein